MMGKSGKFLTRWVGCLATLAFVALMSACGDDGEQTVVGVRVAGARRFPEQQVLNEIKTRQGQPYHENFVQDDLRKLDSTNRYIRVDVERQNRADGVFVVFHVHERAILQDVLYEGAKHLSKDDLEACTGLRRGSPMSVALNRRAAQNIERKYQESGRLLATVELVEGDKDDDVRAVFRVTEGPIVRIHKIYFEGVNFVSAARLKTQIESGEAFLNAIGGKLVTPQLEHDVYKLLDYYKTFGYLDVKVRREVRWLAGYDMVDVVFVVEEGLRYVVKDVQVTGNNRLDSDLLVKDNKLKRGDYFNEDHAKVSAQKMQFEYGREGYVTTRVTAEKRFSDEPGVVTVVYQVSQEGPPARVGEVIIVGNTVTKDNVIRRQILVYPGQIISTPDIQLSERRLAQLNIFKTDPALGIRPTITVLDPPFPDAEERDVLVQVEEDRTGSLLFGVGINSDAGATANIVLNERNFDILRFPTSWDDFYYNRAFRGAGQEFRAEIVPGTQLSRYSVSWREPFLFDTPYSLGDSIYYYSQIFNEYNEQRLGTRVTVGRRFTPEWSASVSFRAEDVKVSNVVPFAPSDYTSVVGNNSVYAPRIAIQRDTRDSILRPTEGNSLEVGYEQGLGDFTFPIFTLSDAQYWTITERPDGSGRQVLSLRGQVGIAGSNTPVFERFFAGGFRTLRGFEFRGVGPDEHGFKVGGDFMAVGSVEYQLPVMASDHIFLVGFSDFGTVEKDVAFREVRVSAGLGLRLVVPMFGPVPIALDWAYPINKAPTDNRQIFSFYLGLYR